jgi:hypothetical protein
VVVVVADRVSVVGRRAHPIGTCVKPAKPVDPSSLPPWKRKKPPGRSTPLSTAQIDAARARADGAGRRYPNLVDNMWAARHVPRGGVDAVHEEE